jgi:PhnB protein
MEIQKEHQVVMPYLVIPNAIKFYDFVKKVFDGEETARFLDDDQSLMHGEVNIGGSTIMFGNSSGQWPPQPAGLYVNVQNADETYQKALDNGATVVMEISNKDYGRTGGVKDPFGNTWWITTSNMNQ